MNFAAVLAAAKRAQAAYIDDIGQARAAFEALGLAFVGQYQNASHQAVVSRDGQGSTYLSISGTRFSQGKVGDLLDDVDLKSVDVGDGAFVTFGAYDGLGDMWTWARNLAPGVVWNVEGHSLGGWRTRYTPLFLPADRIGDLHSFESPKGANAAYWSKYSSQLASLVSVVNGRDLWVSWPFITSFWCHPPRDQIWLQETGFQIATPTQWPDGFRASDHDIDLVVVRLAAIVQQQP